MPPRGTGRKARVIVAGCGRWGRNYVRVLQQIAGFELAACCDPDPKNASEIIRLAQGIPLRHSLKESLRRDRPDAAIISAPAAEHAPLAMEALQAGLHVLIEKPMTTSTRDAERLVSRARKKRRKIIVGHIMRFHRAFQYLESSLRKGRMGKLRYMHAVRTNFGPVRPDVNVLWDLAAHDISMLLGLAGDDVVEVSGNGQSYLRRRLQDITFATLYFRRAGVLGSLHASWIEPNKMRRLTVIGEKQMAVFDDINVREPLKLFKAGVLEEKQYKDFGQFQLILRDGDIEIPHVAMEEPLRVQCEHFLECIRDDAAPISGGEHALKVVRILEAIDASMKRRGRPVKA